MNLTGRFIILGLFSLAAGIGINQLHPDGIRFRQLLLLFPSSYAGNTRTVSSDSALVWMFEESALFIDIRPADRYQIDHIPTAISLPFQNASMDTLTQLPEAFQKKPWVLYDFQSRTKPLLYMARQIKPIHHDSVFLLEGGFAGWLDRGYPAEIGLNDEEGRL
jgi:rhodanese-related sulfurtransferase